MPYQEPEYLPWDGRRVPLTFIAGYLGAGKTTLINAALKATDRPIAVIVNDIGAINIDARLIRNRSGNTIEVSDGCVCCSSLEGFGAAFDVIRARPEPPDHVIVELSGVAEPDRMIPWGRSAGFKLDGIMTLVAADQFAELAGPSKISGPVREQVAAADMLVITKADLVTDETLASLRRQLTDISPGVPTLTADDPSLTSLLLSSGGRRADGSAGLPEPSLFDRHVVETVPLPNPTTRNELDRLLAALPRDVMRAKGIAAGNDGQRWAIQVVGRRREITELPDAELAPPTDLVVIRLPES